MLAPWHFVITHLLLFLLLDFLDFFIDFLDFFFFSWWRKIDCCCWRCCRCCWWNWVAIVLALISIWRVIFYCCCFLPRPRLDTHRRYQNHRCRRRLCNVVEKLRKVS